MISNEELGPYKKWSEQWMKNTKLKYLQCDLGELHQGEKMMFVCIDQKCKNKGLICPVCHETQHKNHKIVHLKVFLGKLGDQFINNKTEQSGQEGKEARMMLNEQLMILQNSRKQLLMSLQLSVKQIAEEVKKIEHKINENFEKIRRILLCQSTGSKKIPQIYNQLLSESSHNLNQVSSKIKSQIKKSVEITYMKNNKLVIGKNTTKVLQSYKEHKDSLITHLMGLMTDIPTKFSTLPLTINNLSFFESSKINPPPYSHEFSGTLKSSGLTISQNKKQAFINNDGFGGIVCVESSSEEESDSIKKIQFRINNSVSDSICLGVCNSKSQLLVNNNFYLDQMTENDGVYGLCAMGINLSDIQSPSMVFSTGDTIEVELNIESSTLSISRKNSIEKEEIYLGLSKQESKELVFFCSLVIMGDSIEIMG